MECVVVLYFVIGILYAVYAYKKYFISPNLLFILTQMIMMAGILTYVDYSYDADENLVLIYLLAQVMFIFGTELAYFLRPITYRRAKLTDNEALSQYQKQCIWLMVIVSILACTYLFVQAGANVFLLILQSLMSNTVSNFTESRLAINSISGVGYIYQFRVIILPILVAYLITTSKGIEKKVSMLLVPIMIMFVLGTGQRGGFVMFVLIFLASLLNINKLYSMNIGKTIVRGVFVFIALFAVMTVYNGRAEQSGSVISAIINRILGDNQECAVIAFRYITAQSTQWGMDWILSLGDILPGKSDYLQLSYIIFEVMYGSTRGTAPPCIWGSVYYNWSIIGMLLFPLAMGIGYYYIYYRLYSKIVTRLRVFIYSAIFVILGMWIADGPMVLFNQGFITVCLMAIILRIDGMRRFEFNNAPFKKKRPNFYGQ